MLKRLFIALLLLVMTSTLAPCGQRYIRFDTQVGGWTATNTLIGGTSAVTATIKSERDDGVTGILELTQMSNASALQDNEIIYEASYGAEINNEGNAASDPNGNEADATTGWTVYGAPTFESTNLGTPSVGTYHLHVDAVVTLRGFFRNVPVTDNEFYFTSVEIKAVTGDARLMVQNNANANTIFYEDFASTSYTPFSVVFQANDVSQKYYIRTIHANEEFYADNISIKKVTNAAFANGTAYGGGRSSW